MKQGIHSSKCFLKAAVIITACFIIPVFIITAGCSKTDNTGSGMNTVQESDAVENTSTGDNSGYMDEKSWEKAQAELKTIERVIKALNEFYDVWGLAYEHRTFLRFKEAIETADYLSGKLDNVVNEADSIRQVPGYAEIDKMKECYLKMIPLLQSGSRNLKLSIIAARDKNQAEENKNIKEYTAKWKQAMEYSRKSFAIMQETLTRGSRTEYQKMAGVKGSTESSAAGLKTVIKKSAGRYDSVIIPKIAGIKKLAGTSQWDATMTEIDAVVSLLQSSIMEAGQAEPGDRKELWDARQELVTMLSQQMMAMKKYREYAEKTKAGNIQEAGQAGKVYEILRKSADEARGKLRKTGY